MDAEDKTSHAKSMPTKRAQLDLTKGHVGITLGKTVDFGEVKGVQVDGVDPADLAAKAGLTSGNVVLKVNGRDSSTHTAAMDDINSAKDKLTITYLMAADAERLLKEHEAALSHARRQERLRSLRCWAITCLILFLPFGFDLMMQGPSFGAAFMERNKQQHPDIVALPSGLQYRVLAHGNGTEHAARDTFCWVTYEGRLLRHYLQVSTVGLHVPSVLGMAHGANPLRSTFDASTSDDGKRFKPREVIPGWSEAMINMVVGDSWQIFVPPHLGYGAHGAGPIGGGETLVFTLTMKKIKVGQTLPKRTPGQHFEWKG